MPGRARPASQQPPLLLQLLRRRVLPGAAQTFSRARLPRWLLRGGTCARACVRVRACACAHASGYAAVVAAPPEYLCNTKHNCRTRARTSTRALHLRQRSVTAPQPLHLCVLLLLLRVAARRRRHGGGLRPRGLPSVHLRAAHALEVLLHVAGAERLLRLT